MTKFAHCVGIILAVACTLQLVAVQASTCDSLNSLDGWTVDCRTLPTYTGFGTQISGDTTKCADVGSNPLGLNVDCGIQGSGSYLSVVSGADDDQWNTVTKAFDPPLPAGTQITFTYRLLTTDYIDDQADVGTLADVCTMGPQDDLADVLVALSADDFTGDVCHAQVTDTKTLTSEATSLVVRAKNQFDNLYDIVLSVDNVCFQTFSPDNDPADVIAQNSTCNSYFAMGGCTVNDANPDEGFPRDYLTIPESEEKGNPKCIEANRAKVSRGCFYKSEDEIMPVAGEFYKVGEYHSVGTPHCNSIVVDWSDKSCAN